MQALHRNAALHGRYARPSAQRTTCKELFYLSARGVLSLGTEVTPMILQEPDRRASAERRYAPRAPSSLLVRLGNGRTRAEALCADISMGGVLLQRELPAAIAHTHLYLDVAVQLPGDPRPIRAMARRVWSRGSSLGLRFLKMSELDRLRLAEHIDRATRAPGSSP